MAYWPNVYTICASLVCDDSNQVLDGDDNPIEGLYAAGEVTGGFHGTNRLGGNAIADCLANGRIAGLTVVSDN